MIVIEDSPEGINKKNKSMYNNIELNQLIEAAKKKKKELSCSIMLLIFCIGLALGLYYLNYDEIFFKYDSISPTFGFIIFVVLGILFVVIAGIVYQHIHRKYNLNIIEANDKIKAIYQSRDCTQEQFFLLKRFYIENNLGTDKVSQLDYEWHNKVVCWGCGEEHRTTPIPFKYTKEKLESWRKDAFRYHQTFRKTAIVYLCPACYERLSKAKKIQAGNEEVSNRINWAICVIISVICSLYVYLTSSEAEIYFTAFSVFGTFVLSLGLSRFIGQLLIYPISLFISKPFTNSVDNGSSKWDFDNIPQIRLFLTEDQHKK